ncbi:MAG: efflux RND transporter permease subunit [Clostridium sp.]|jgi:predicted RND superfamily exporter protein
MKLKFLHKRETEMPKEKRTFSLPVFIIERSRAIEIFFFVLVFISLITAPFVNINYDLTRYLPDTVQSKKGLDLMEEKFGYPGTGRIMIEDVTLYEAKAYKDKLEDIEGIDQILWLDTGTSVFSSDAFINFDSIDEYYKDNCAVMDVVFEEGDTDKKTSQAIDAMQELLGEKGHYVGMAVQNKSLQENVTSEMKLILSLAVVIIFVILCLTTTSWFEPFLYLVVMGVAILINRGTNIFLGEVSFITNSVSAVLQLACSMDYSIFLSHAFAREKGKGKGQMEALTAAIQEAMNSIFASSLTTIVGFLVLCFMKFTIGFDMGIVLAKGIVISLLTVVFFMPAMILRMTPMIERTSHRSFLPSFDRLSRGIYRSRKVILVAAALLVIPAYTAQNMNSFLYGNDAVGAAEGTKVYADDQLILQKFGRSNMMMAIVPNTSPVDEREFTEEVEALPYTKSVTSMAGTLPEGIPEEFLPSSITEMLHKGDYSRILIYVKSKGESPLAYQCSDEIQTLMRDHYPEGSYLVGATPSTQDIQTTITKDYSLVNVLSLLGVFLVVMWSFKSLIIPLIIMIPIETAIFINMAVPYIAGDTMIFIGYIVVSCIQLGATVDYAILTANNYLECRRTADKREAAIEALNRGIPAILTSGSILTCAGYIVYHISTVAAIADLGHLIGRGALISLILVCAMMPAFLVLFDRILMENEFDRIRMFIKKRRKGDR